MNAMIEDYNGHCYTVVPCYVSDSSRIHYCGAYAKDFKTWRVRDDLRDAAEATSQQASNINKYVKKLSSEAAADVQTTLQMSDGTDGAM